jgi:predicted chitinase
MIKNYRDFLLEDAASDYTQKFDTFKSRIKDLTGIDLSPNQPAEKSNAQNDTDDTEDNPTTGEVKSNFEGSRKEMIDLVIEYLNKYQITNPFIQKAILSTIAKESGFEKFKETSYKSTSAQRIREVYSSTFAGMSDAEINDIKKDDNKFWEKVYGGKNGNNKPGDGAKYVGRGFNGLTGKENYQKYNDLLRKNGVNVDIVTNPSLLNTNKRVAAEVNALYFLNGLNDSTIKNKYGNSDQNDFQDFDTALKAAVNTNAGPGTDITRGFAKETYDKALAASNQFDINTTTA